MNFTYNLDNGILTVSLEGRLDTEASIKFEADLQEICRNNPHESMILDAEKLQYVASSGLRTVLKLAKTEKNFSIENVSPAVYSVFEMTGFSRIINIRKALRKIDLEKCERIGFGGNGAVYRVSEDEIVKVNYNPSTYAALDKELAKAKEAFLLGIPTAISFDLVDCGEGRRGVVYETIKSRTLGETIQSISPFWIMMFLGCASQCTSLSPSGRTSSIISSIFPSSSVRNFDASSTCFL